jgi:phosphoribosyl-dephospho-CoA transferase
MSQKMMRRHDLVWLATDIDAGRFAADAGHANHARNWVERGWPLVVARQPESGDQISLGFTLPSTPTRQRIALRVPRTAIIRHSRPLPLMDTVDHAPHNWRAAMFSLQALCTRNGVVPRVYGSLSSQALTGASYLDEASDLDLLLECSAATRLDELLAALEAFPLRSPRIDGEILAPSGWAVAWRELAEVLGADEPRKVLAKSDREARLIPVEQLFTDLFSVGA